MNIDSKFKSTSVSIKSLTLISCHTNNQTFIGVKVIPELYISKNEVSLKMIDLQMFYSDESFDFCLTLANCEKLKQLRKVIKPFTLVVNLLRRTENRLSLDFKFLALELFVSDRFLEILSGLLGDIMSIKLLNKDSFVGNLRKDNLRPQLKTRRPIKLKTTLGSGGFLKSKRTSRKNSSQTFMTAGSGFDDEFFDAFEDETELFAHNELKTRMQLIENVNMILASDLAIIEEKETGHYENFRDQDEEKTVPMELAISVSADELAIILYSNNDIQNYL